MMMWCNLERRNTELTYEKQAKQFAHKKKV